MQESRRASQSQDTAMHGALVPALFLHIQKTAGTSIVHLARKHYGNENVVSHGDYLAGWKGRSLDEIVAARGRSPDDLCGFAFVSGHFGYDFARSLMDGRYSFTFLRDPRERILSYYYFCRTRDPREFEIYELAREKSLDEFLRCGLESKALKACIWNNQTWQLANGYGNLNGRRIESFSDEELLANAIDHLQRFSFIGFSENFEADRNKVFAALNIESPNENVTSNANPGRPRVEDLAQSTVRLLDELTELDRILYREARALRDARLHSSGLTRKIVNFGKSIKTWLVS